MKTQEQNTLSKAIYNVITSMQENNIIRFPHGIITLENVDSIISEVLEELTTPFYTRMSEFKRMSQKLLLYTGRHYKDVFPAKGTKKHLLRLVVTLMSINYAFDRIDSVLTDD